MTSEPENEDSVDSRSDDEKIKAFPKMVSRFSILPAAARKDSMFQKHTDEHGNVDMGGMATEAALTRQNYKMLVKALIAAVLLIFLLVLSTFGVSLAAAILAKDTQVDSGSGALMVKNGSGDSAVVKTQEALFNIQNPRIADMSFRELRAMKKIALNGDSGSDVGIQLDVKGVSKTASGQVTIVVEGGGTIVYNGDAIVNATGIAKTLLKSLEMDYLNTTDDHNRKLVSDTMCQGIFGMYPCNSEAESTQPAQGTFYPNCCVPGYNNIGTVKRNENILREACKLRCIITQGCVTADTWQGECYMSSAGTEHAEYYPNCDMWAAEGQPEPDCDPP